MLMHPSLLHFIFLLLPLTFSSSIIKPECLDRCGNLSIPFPFGVGPNCSIGPSFDIICNTSTNPPKAYLSINKTTQVIEIVLDPPQIRVKFPNLALACYNLSGYPPKRDLYVNFSATQYTLSDNNWLTAIGCDDMVTGLGFFNQKLGGGCISYCADMDDSGGIGYCPNLYSPGNGCCQIPIPRGATNLRASLDDLHERWQRHNKTFHCSYAFVGERRIWDSAGFSYNLSYLDGNSMDTLNDDVVPYMRLDWRIGAQNCSEAQRNFTTNYTCQDNSFCVDFDATIGGYTCRCSNGYDGNPYLSSGCHDINECAAPINDDSSNPCLSSCINTPGSFTCLCPKGYSGDGKKNGTGCKRLPLSKMINVLIGLGSGMGFLLLLLSTCFWLQKVLKNRQCKEKFFKRNGGLLLQQQTNEGTLEKTKLFPVKELEKATDHFNESRVLGQGGQGTVYKGMLSNGKIVAIKKSKLVDEDQLEQFINEVVILSQINHRNVVKLLGCCLETEVPLLVYEFVPNGTLFDLIHDPISEFVSWNMRLKIAADIAGALAYLHSASSLPIYHRDIKSSNILLDEKYIVKVSDFGISRSIAVDQTHLTTQVKGTFGYFDPEYFQSSQFTEKSDVYSFGVVLVELLTGQRPISLEKTESDRSLVARFLATMEEYNLHMILDPQVSDQGKKEEVIAVARLAQRCLNSKGKMRPTMKEVATELESFRISQLSSIVKDESEEAKVNEANTTTISSIQYSWTASGNSVASLSSDTHPLMFATM